MSCPECGFPSDDANESQSVCPACGEAGSACSPEYEWDEDMARLFQEPAAESPVPPGGEPA